jgi:hypothetical protein
MREKARSLGFRGAESADAPGITRGDRLQELARLAAAVAAKAAPVALGYAEAARNVGASEAAIGVAIGIGRTVRAKAQAFSDEELGEGAEGKEGARGPKGTCSCRASP